MRVLNLSDNSLTARGSKSIAAVLPFLPNLEILQIDDCLIRSAGADYLSSVLDDNACVPKLQELHLSGNEISRDAAVRLVLSLSTKRHLRYLNLNTNELGSKGIDDVIQAMASIGILHTVFRNGMLKNDQGNITKDVALEAFDDDQGSESEESEDPDEAEGYESRSDDYSDLADADITKLKVTNQSSSAFSFTATLEMLKQTQELSKTSNGPRNESKRNTDSLFSDVPTQGSYTNLFAPPKLTYPSSTSVIPKNDECEITTALVDCLSSESGTLIAFVRLASKLFIDVALNF
ncbi:unnamed protein product [Protopolystoma xenopodis]|uniref:Ran-GTPase activating protein 1 C-terminal domain-containing protein n=1 Tax=Protopolystoma xenopodis TaxID=117903 RepID=A0A448X7J1_9PLAT|nr:unnamed protein product [Protopolystoma xenopodis]